MKKKENIFYMLLNRKKGNAKPSMSFISLEMNDIKKGHKKLKRRRKTDTFF